MRGALACTFGMLAIAAPARAAFERPPHDAESAALGGLVATSTDPVWGNPATPSAGPWFGALACHPFGLAELTEVQAGARGTVAGVALGAGARRFGSDLYAEREARVTAAFGRSGSWIGVAVRGMEVSGAGFPAVRAAAADAAVRARVAGLELGAVVDAVAGEVPGDPEGAARRAAIGARRTVTSFTVALEVRRRGREPLAGVIGVAWQPAPALRLWSGARGDPAELSWGFAVGAGPAAGQVAVTHTAPLAPTVRVGIMVGRGPARSNPAGHRN